MPISTTYTISNTQGSLTFTLTAGSSNGPNELAQSTDLTFYGYGRTGWGQQVDQNFYSLLENFACQELTPGVPKTKTQLGGVLGVNDPIVGQQWFNLSSKEMYVCDQLSPITWRHLLSETYADTKYLTIAGAGAGTGAFVKLNGSNSPMTGELLLSGNPINVLGATPKQYVDNAISTLSTSSGTTYVLKAGDTMTGPLHVTTGGVPAVSLNVSSSNATIKLGTTASATTPFIDFNSSLNANTYDSRIIASGGVATDGQGTLTLIGFILSDGRTPTLTNELTNKGYVDTQISAAIGGLGLSSLYVHKAGDTMSGVLNMGGNKISNVAQPAVSTDVATAGWTQSFAYGPSGTGFTHQIWYSTLSPSGGNDGDIWFQY